mmetsp:Transcript_18793/g.28566  ORF Transcript_18793/g.28566 Transcript_18793/m.28566 type:complete len:588 (-) Transcript_18793:132-1895(-)|eukprot:CAMPEP_0194083550 /NCGR_PEP_ID=MMETSP0149-20130528/9552_1 /TAXON_ID=122233 /ORGANISM="Chaetoceros debilis, Strain MM31A-1" /LENGTH=587 /DNA_ID=CAMNT_0038765983 /DNA_START=67 /DNA_END=1830 /DNA_ORIENTATION=+
MKVDKSDRSSIDVAQRSKLLNSASMKRAINKVSKETPVKSGAGRTRYVSSSSLKKSSQSITNANAPVSGSSTKNKREVVGRVTSPRTLDTHKSNKSKTSPVTTSETKSTTTRKKALTATDKGKGSVKGKKAKDAKVKNEVAQNQSGKTRELKVVQDEGITYDDVENTDIPPEKPSSDNLENDQEMGDDDVDLGPRMKTTAGNRRNLGERTLSEKSEAEGRDARDITRKVIADILRESNDELTFESNGHDVPVSYGPSITNEVASMALMSSAFLRWQARVSRVVGTKRIEVRHVEIQSVDFIDEEIDGVKIQTHCVLIDEELDGAEEEISSICYLCDTRVGVLLELACVDDGSSWSILVDQPRVPIGSVSTLELPVGILDEDEEKLFGYEIDEIEEACGLSINMNDLIDLSQEAYSKSSVDNASGLCPSPSHSGEQVKIMYMKQKISKAHLLGMRARFSKQREEGLAVTMRVVPTQDIWKVSSDMKVMCALFLLQKVNLSEEQMLLNGRRRKIANGEDVGFSDDISVRSTGNFFTNISSVERPMSAPSTRSEADDCSTSTISSGRSKLSTAVSGIMSTLKESLSPLEE